MSKYSPLALENTALCCVIFRMSDVQKARTRVHFGPISQS